MSGNRTAPKGFLVPPRPPRKPVSELDRSELNERYDLNRRTLTLPGSSAVMSRLAEEQVLIEARLRELDTEAIQDGLLGTHISAPETNGPRMLNAKRKAIARAFPEHMQWTGATAPMSLSEAAQLEQRAHADKMERIQKREEAREKRGMFPRAGDMLTRQQMDARMLAFLAYKPTDSDLEDDEDEDMDDEDDDPAEWFEDDQDDGRKGQNIVDPDGYTVEDISHVIRIDESKLRSMQAERDLFGD